MTDEDFDACLLGLQRLPMNAAASDQRTYCDEEESLSPLEQAAEECCAIFDRLEPGDKRALAARLVALGALHQGDLAYVDQVAELARAGVLEFLGDVSGTA